MSESSRLNFPYIVSSHILDALVQPVVEGVLVNAPPVNPVAGMLYIIGSSPSGVWSGKEKCLTQYIGETWAFYIPFEGLSVWNKATKTQWSFVGNQWSETKVEQHIKRNDNPHSVTAAQVGAETPTGAQAKIDIHVNKAASAHSASAISVAATGNIGAINVQAALAELDAEKLDVSDVVTTPIANKIVRLNSNAKLPASITGDADTLDGYHAVSFVKTTDAVDAAKLNGQPGTYYSATSHTHTTATSVANGFMSIADKQKLDNLVAGTQQNTFGTIKVGTTNVEADAPNDVLELVAGTNIALTPDAVNDRVTIGVTGKVASAAAADNATTIGGISPSQFVRVDGTNIIAGDNSLLFGPNSGWGQYLRIGGNSNTDTTKATVVTSDGNLHIDAKATKDTYINYFSGNKINFGNGTNAIKSFIDSNGVFNGTATYASTAGSAPANGGTATYSTYQWSTSHPGTYYVSNSWDGTYWRLSSNHGAAVRVGYADSVPWAGVTGKPAGADFDAGHSFSANGYQKLSNGLIIQWGTTPTTAPNTTATNNVVFPIAFPNACFAVTMPTGQHTRSNSAEAMSTIVSKNTTGFGYQSGYGYTTTQAMYIALGY